VIFLECRDNDGRWWLGVTLLNGHIAVLGWIGTVVNHEIVWLAEKGKDSEQAILQAARA
jgi:hypothetical protein